MNRKFGPRPTDVLGLRWGAEMTPCTCGQWHMPRDIYVEAPECRDRDLRITIVCPVCGAAWNGVGKAQAPEEPASRPAEPLP